MIIPFLVFAQLGTVQLHASVTPDTVYVGQQVSYDAATLVDDAARLHLRANPSYTPSEVRGATVYDFPFDTAAISDVTIAGVHFRRYLYHRALFPINPGTYDIPPSTLQYALPMDESYDSPLQSYTIQSEPATLVVRPLPIAGQPLDFLGAVGDFSIEAHPDGATPRVGDTFVFTVRVSGVGNINLLPRPSFSMPWASTVPGEERVTWDSTGINVRGAKEFDWIVTPNLSGEMIIPEVRYPYFNPSTRQYVTKTAPQTKITVEAAGQVAQPQSNIPHDEIGDSPFPVILGAIRANPVLTAGVAVGILAFVVLVVVILRRRPSDE